jgi:zinc transport system substrate-binding protein
LKRLILLLALLAASGVAGAVPRVVASIAPIHSIIADVMDGVGEPELLLSADRSPHSYSMRPSEARMLGEADLVVWVGPQLETFMTRSLAALSGDARVVALGEDSAMHRLPYRDTLEESGDAGHSGHAGHEHAEEFDPHLWLSLANARRTAELTATHLAEIDPGNAARYRSNADRVMSEYESIQHDMRQRLLPVAEIPFMVFHDAYQYFEQEMGLNNRGAISVRPELSPGVERMQRLRRQVSQAGLQCIFSEPQFPESLVDAVAEGTGVRIGQLDPLGVDIESGAGGYPALIRSFTDSILECLLPAREG